MRASITTPPGNAISLYFGKIPSRGDFVKSVTGAKIVAHIDSWLTRGMEMLIAQPCWKGYYDDAGPIDFLFIAPHKRHAICGALIGSADASARRFPFAAATLFEIDDALALLPVSPLLLERHVSRQRMLVQRAARVQDAADPLAILDGMPLETDLSLEEFIPAYRRFLLETTITDLAKAIDSGTEQATVRQMVLSIGYLLQTVRLNHALLPKRGLAIPLPHDPADAVFIKALWLDLVSTFLSETEFELGIFSCVHYGTPKLIVTFNGATPFAFHALFEEQAADQYLIDMAQAVWVEEYAAQNAAAYKLSGYLEHDGLSLRHLVDIFRQEFLA